MSSFSSSSSYTYISPHYLLLPHFLLLFLFRLPVLFLLLLPRLRVLLSLLLPLLLLILTLSFLFRFPLIIRELLSLLLLFPLTFHLLSLFYLVYFFPFLFFLFYFYLIFPYFVISLHILPLLLLSLFLCFIHFLYFMFHKKPRFFTTDVIHLRSWQSRFCLYSQPPFLSDKYERFKVITTAILKTAVCRDVTPCRFVAEILTIWSHLRPLTSGYDTILKMGADDPSETQVSTTLRGCTS